MGEIFCIISLVEGWVENIVGKGENARYQRFSPLPTMFSKAFSYRVSVKLVITW